MGSKGLLKAGPNKAGATAPDMLKGGGCGVCARNFSMEIT